MRAEWSGGKCRKLWHKEGEETGRRDKAVPEDRWRSSGWGDVNNGVEVKLRRVAGRGDRWDPAVDAEVVEDGDGDVRVGEEGENAHSTSAVATFGEVVLQVAPPTRPFPRWRDLVISAGSRQWV